MAKNPKGLSRKISMIPRVVKLLAVMTTMVIALVVVVGFSAESSVSGQPGQRVRQQSEKAKQQGKRIEFETVEQFDARGERISSEERALLESRIEQREALSDHDEDELAKETQSPRRKVRRFHWESPAETRGKIWNIPEEESEQALLTAFLRVCIAEADGEPLDCVGIWQVMKNIRRRQCERADVRRITECEEDGGETMLSVIRRSQPHILAVPGYKLRNRRAAWIRNLETSCEVPEGWTDGENRWDAQYSSRCQYAVELGRYLIKGELPPERPGHRLSWLSGHPITWGGRCETGRGSCDDRIACSRGLARIPDTNTHNAFWCRIGRPGCRSDAEPICVQLGYGHLGQVQNQEDVVETQTEPVATREQQDPQESILSERPQDS